MNQTITFPAGESIRIQARHRLSNGWDTVVVMLSLRSPLTLNMLMEYTEAAQSKQPLEPQHLPPPPASPSPLDQHMRQNKQMHGAWYAEWTVVATQCKRGTEGPWYAIMKGTEVYVHHYADIVTASELLLDAETMCSCRNQAEAIMLPTGFEFSDTPGPDDGLGRSLCFDLDDSSFGHAPADTIAAEMAKLNLRWIVPIGYKGAL